jgi:hypothetical protein
MQFSAVSSAVIAVVSVGRTKDWFDVNDVGFRALGALVKTEQLKPID